jgi:hypothetical protein
MKLIKENTKASGIHIAIYYIFLRYIFLTQLGRELTLIIEK